MRNHFFCFLSFDTYIIIPMKIVVMAIGELGTFVLLAGKFEIIITRCWLLSKIQRKMEQSVGNIVNILTNFYIVRIG